MSWSFSQRKPGIKSLAKPLASHMAQRLLPILHYPWFGSYEMDWNGSIRQSIYNWHQFFLLPMPKDYDGLCQHSESLWASRPPVHNWLTSVNACARWWLFNTVNAFGLKDVGFITLKPFSVMTVNNWFPAPFSKMSTNALRTLSNTLISLKVRKQLWKQVLLHLWSMQHISNRNSDVPFAWIICCLTTHDFSFVNSLIFQSEPYRMTRLMQTMQPFMRCEWSTFKPFCCWVEILFGFHKPLILSVGRGPLKLNKLGDFD